MRVTLHSVDELNDFVEVHNGEYWASTTTVFYRWALGAAQYNRSLLLVGTGSCPVQPQSFAGGHWELPSTTVCCWFLLWVIRFIDVYFNVSIQHHLISCYGQDWKGSNVYIYMYIYLKIE